MFEVGEVFHCANTDLTYIWLQMKVPVPFPYKKLRTHKVEQVTRSNSSVYNCYDILSKWWWREQNDSLHLVLYIIIHVTLTTSATMLEYLQINHLHYHLKNLVGLFVLSMLNVYCWTFELMLLHDCVSSLVQNKLSWSKCF